MGRLAVDPHEEIGLMIDREMDNDPTLLTRFRPDDLAVLDYCGQEGNSTLYAFFRDLSGLKCLNVSGTTFSDIDLSILPYLKNLICLNLSTSDVDCTELAKYEEIYNLRFLDISHTNKPEDVLKLVPIRQHQVGVELHASLLEAPENADNLFPGKKLDFCHAVPPLSVPALCWICILKLKRVQGPRVATKTRSHTFVNEVLQNVEIEIDQGRVLVRLLQATRVMRHREAVDRIGEHRTKNGLRVPDLRHEDVHRPHGVAAV